MEKRTMLTIELDLDAVEALLDLLDGMDKRTPAQELAREMLRDAHTTAAEAYWTDKWSGL